MRNLFLSKTPAERLKEMRLLLKEFSVRAARLAAPFTILVYGSASYGLKKSKFGNLDDIDLFLIIPNQVSVEEILQIAEQVFQTDLDVEPDHLQHLLKGNWEMCRMYGESKGIRLGFRIMGFDVFNLISSSDGSVSNIRNIAKIGQSRIVVDVEWSIPDWKYVPVELEHEIITHSSGALLLVKQHVFSSDMEQLGALGRKLLTCKVVYDSAKGSRFAIDMIWKLYVKKCVRHHPDISSGGIVDSVMRSEKFSPAFRRRLIGMVEKART